MSKPDPRRTRAACARIVGGAQNRPVYDLIVHEEKSLPGLEYIFDVLELVARWEHQLSLL